MCVCILLQRQPAKWISQRKMCERLWFTSFLRLLLPMLWYCVELLVSFRFRFLFYNVIKLSRALLALLTIPHGSSSHFCSHSQNLSLSRSLSFAHHFFSSVCYQWILTSSWCETSQQRERRRKKILRRINYNPIFCTIISLYSPLIAMKK